jgi:aryl-alcohol dehydrogenase-like predicted oxidoreductase
MRELVPKLASEAATLGVSAAQLAMAFSASHPAIDTVLFGATQIWQLDEAVRAIELARTRREEVRGLVEQFRLTDAKGPPLFDPTVGLH